MHSRAIEYDTEPTTADRTLGRAQSGRLYMVQQGSSEITITLPAAIAGHLGVYFVFMLNSAGSADIIIDSGAANGIRGATFGAAIESIDNNLIKIVGGTAMAGDRIEVYCDGNIYWCTNWQQADNSIVGANS